ncbi:hypothetical protein F4861DRAFT_544376 [Xylaria intraflava]|nr:hypothetical protein F4861DRAFT_544376 [Xylaria intraflava]
MPLLTPGSFRSRYTDSLPLMTRFTTLTWTEYIAIVKKCDMQYRAHLAEMDRQPTHNRPSPPQGSSKALSCPLVSTASATTSLAPATSHSTASNSGHYGPAPMDLSAARRRLTPKEKKKWLEESRCLYCGGFYHMAKNCPNKKS